MKPLKQLLIIAFCLSSGNAVFGQPQQRGVQIMGTEIYSEARLKKALRLNRFRTFTKGRARYIRRAIHNYYRRRGYRHARVYIAAYQRRFLALYVDEGKLARIVFHNVNALDILRMRREFDLKGDVYHRSKIRKELRKLKKQFNLKRIYSRLEKSRDFEKASFQLNRDLNFLENEESPLTQFNEPSPRYILNVYVKKKKGKQKGFVFGARLNFRYGIIPWVQYRHPDWLVKDDKLNLELAIGIYYGLNLKFSETPSFRYARLKGEYDYKPIIGRSVTPKVKTVLRRTREDREDIGLDQYVDLRARLSVGPGWQIYRGIQFFASYGYEAISLASARFTDEADPAQAPLNGFILPDSSFRDDANTGWQIISAELKFDFQPNSLKYDIDQEITLGYDFYLASRSFSKLFLLAKIEYEFENFDLFITSFKYDFMFDSGFSSNSGVIPFYYEERIAGKYFRGFIGRDFHSRNLARLANNYRTSLYKDFIYGGLFFDLTAFEGSGYDLSGLQLGIVGGLSAHFLLLDQFNFNLYFGRDLVITETRLSQFNLYLSALLKF